MEKKQATLFSFFKPGGKQAETDPAVEPASSRPTTASSSPKASPNDSLEGDLQTDSVPKVKKAPPSRKRKVTASRVSDSESESSSSSSSDSSSSEDSSMSSEPSPSRVRSNNKQRITKKPRKAVDDSSETTTVSIDVESLYSFGKPLEALETTRTFQAKSLDDSSSEPILSVEEIDKMCKDVPSYVAQFTRLYYELTARFEFPSWYNPRNLRDKQRRAPTDPDYDVSTLYVPRKNGKVTEDGHSTPMLQQYWDIKEDHFCEIILFKVGKFYELFYIDAAIAQQVCSLKWMGHDRRAHVGFPETSLQHHAALLIEQAYTVCVVEQTETVNEANERSANAGRKSTGALVERRICEVFTTGTLIHEDMLSGRNTHYLCAITGNVEKIAIVMVDCAVGQFQVGQLSSISSLKTVLYSYQPREIIYDQKSTNCSLIKLLTASKETLGIVLTRWNMEGSSKSTIPDRMGADLKPVIESDRDLSTVVNGVVSYLGHLLLDEQVVQCGDWQLLNSVSPTAPKTLMMDSTVLSQLEILKDSEQSDRGSLFKFLDRTSTSFGSRLLQRWVCAPLADSVSINKRLDAVEWFISKPNIRKKLEEKLKDLPDLERRLQRICAMALQQQRNAVYFGEVEKKRIGVFLSFLSSIESSISTLEWLGSEVDTSLLTELCSGGSEQIKHLCENLSHKIESNKKDGSFQPRKGAFEEYDLVGQKLRDLGSEFKHELDRIKTELGIKGEAIYVSIKYKNEVEVPCEYESRLNGIEADITSCRKGYVRFHTQRIKDLVQQSDDLEQQLKDLLYPFMARLFGEVNESKFMINQVIARVAHLDCLLALAKVASQGSGWNRPVFGGFDSGISLKDSRHPIQEHLMQLERPFVPNSIELGNPESILIVTGANMGGKSTILRQVCINIILAQIGSFVPCSSCCIAHPVDRIFTRIGASDNILEGKSTFLTELEETAVMLKEATCRSLLVIDELGRGTSTYDGVAIAGATLGAIAELGCACLFATHYHKLCQEENIKNLEKVGNTPIGLFHMECVTDGGIQLTHKFKRGLYPHSQAMHVARLAGIPQSIISEADQVSKQFLSCMQ